MSSEAAKLAQAALLALAAALTASCLLVDWLVAEGPVSGRFGPRAYVRVLGADATPPMLASASRVLVTVLASVAATHALAALCALAVRGADARLVVVGADAALASSSSMLVGALCALAERVLAVSGPVAFYTGVGRVDFGVPVFSQTVAPLLFQAGIALSLASAAIAAAEWGLSLKRPAEGAGTSS